MKIIAVSNHDNERVDDVLVCDSISNRKIGTEICHLLNNLYSQDTNSPYYYMLVEDDRKLHKFEA